jgi:hypothetical protein
LTSIDYDEARIRPDSLRLLRTYDEQLCPICRKPLGYHIIVTQQVESAFAHRRLHLEVDLACGSKNA